MMDLKEFELELSEEKIAKWVGVDTSFIKKIKKSLN
jgi:hypothetical protein